ncbi:type IV pilus modification protein PilV [Pseudomonas fluorescens]|uniref:Type IV pilus modification protein PilV n=1 Tax=Pseudomonas fluorescens TaxID=294 RepID=A0AAE2Q2G1_PSEFL|nr:MULTISPECIES: type IV pilus modification protein PilV [Pseudomonas fluorescens group]MBA1427060.1 type IV pilus modification protein PilV [Pseudomonas orientalis]MBD8147365.1 type IV pilus modification protein PilV [Pseudomonas fluorescens]MBD8175837.1 type IV pilus modification protein PilV [Pseudomonas fluorescens]MBD8272479.1 type IV pilus modification protein PilV [Pseudomonas fluorescens]MBD8744292.1 type IV pilus modification protein PilV [Pseudomonas fluorescens]
MPFCRNRLFLRAVHRPQSGMTLIEVLVALLVLALGLLGAAAIQLNALKYTDSARMTSQASFIAYDMLDRIRANAGVDYAWAQAERAPPGTSTASVRDLDLHDFETNILGFAGKDAKGAVTVSGNAVTISISWDDARAAGSLGTRQIFTLTSRIANDQGRSQ